MINENHNVETEESGERDTVTDERGNESSHHDDAANGVYVSKSIDSAKEQKRSFEKGTAI